MVTVSQSDKSRRDVESTRLAPAQIRQSPTGISTAGHVVTERCHGRRLGCCGLFDWASDWALDWALHGRCRTPECLDELTHLLPELRRTQLGDLAETEHVENAGPRLFDVPREEERLGE